MPSLIVNSVVVMMLLLPCFSFANGSDDLIQPNRNFVLSEQESQFIQSLAPLKVMVDENFVPLSYYDPKTRSFQGVGVDLFRHLADRLGLKYQLLRDAKLSWSDKVELFKNRKIDLLMSVSITAERATDGIFTTSFYETYYGVIAKKSRHISIKDSYSMAAFKVGVTKATAIIPFIRSFVPASRIIFYDNPRDLYQGVRNGQIDIALRNIQVFQEERFNLELFDLAMAHTIVESPRRYAYYLNKAESNKKLVEIIDRYLTGVDYSRLVVHYERGEDELVLRYINQKQQKKLLVLVIAGTAALLALLCIAYLNHRRLAKKLAASLEQARDSEERFRALHNASFAGIVIHDNGFILDCNQELSNMTGFTPEELVGMNGLKLIAPEWHELAVQNVQSDFDQRYQIEGLRKDGTKYPLALKGKSISYKGRTARVSEFQDITDRIQTEKALEETNRKLETLSITDGLTGIANRRHFDEVLAKEHARHGRSGAKLSLILLDIDLFKAFNDNYGHVNGDECLRQIARVIADCAARPADLAARYGGEEFAYILPETDLNGAINIAEKIRRGILALAIPHKGSNVADYVTASLGVVTVRCTADKSVKDVLVQVDELLYRAKSSGRNRVEFVPEGDVALASAGEVKGNLIQLVWNDSFCCGNQLIDSQHRSLFQIFNELLESVLSARPSTEISAIIARLIDDVRQHFHDEEVILETAGFSGKSQHAAEHARLLAKTLQLAQEFKASTRSVGDVFLFLVHEVIMQHMLEADREFFPYTSYTAAVEPDSVL